jgi:hypothetical protein
MARGKKSVTQVDTDAAWSFLDGVSKTWLADLAVDLVRRNAGDENLDGMPLVDAIIREAEPITNVRQDTAAVMRARSSAVKGEARDASGDEGDEGDEVALFI